MTLTATDPPTDPRTDVVVPVPEGPGRRAAATLSCRLHGAIAAASTATASTIVVDAGDRTSDPDIARVLACARDCATTRGVGFVVR